MPNLFQHMTRLLLRVSVLVLLLTMGATSVFAQQVDDEPTDQQEEASPFATFDEVRVQRVKPNELPDYRPGLPRGSSSRMSSNELPRALRDGDLDDLTEVVAAATVEIITVQRPPRPYRATEMVYRGHALWISPKKSGDDPVLVGTADWLREADEIYAIAGDVGHALSRGGLEAGDQTSQRLSDFKAGNNQQLLEKYRDSLIPLEVVEANQHLNLARLAATGDEDFEGPDTGFVIHDMSTVLPGHIFGYSPAVGTSVTPITYGNSENLELEYSFYFLINFTAVLGAPVVGPDGTLIAISALRYPEDGTRSLAIPPGAIHAFLDTGRADPDADDDD